jgi:peptidoglycan/xylan/chitin deacetylase (PgdA/CDA1 family)
MNKHKKWIFLLAAIMLVTTAACGNKTATPAAAPSSETPQPMQTAPVEPAAPPQQPAAETKPAPKEAQPTATKPAAKLYKMNKIYDIVPLDPAAADKNVVLLTFDDGPRNKAVLESMLDTLDKHNAKAIFFVNGYLVKQHPEMLKTITDRGQTIGNHSWDHIDLKKEGRDKQEQQVGDVQTIVKQVTGSAPQFFRPPFGSGNDELRATVKKENMLYMTWSNGSLDWEMTVKKNDPDKVITNVLGQLRPGSNILMHELPWTAEALDKLLTQIKEKQYGFVDPSTIEIEQ